MPGNAREAAVKAVVHVCEIGGDVEIGVYGE